MDRFVYYLTHRLARENAAKAIMEALEGYRVEVRPPTRSLEQNDKFHALCSDISKRVPFGGKMRTPAEWKVLLISAHAVATKVGSEMVPGIEGEFVNLREASSKMSAARLSSLIDYAQAYFECCLTSG